MSELTLEQKAEMWDNFITILIDQYPNIDKSEPKHARDLARSFIAGDQLARSVKSFLKDNML